jgi:MFS family permease
VVAWRPNWNPARRGVSAAFVAHAVISGSWASRVPAIKHGLGLSDTQLGLALFGMALGTLIGGRLGGVVASTLGARTVVRLGLPTFGGALLLTALAPDLGALAVLLVAFGVIAAVVDVAMNSEAVVVERQHRLPLISGFHGLWSVGLLVGALGGVAAAAVGIRPSVQFALVAVVVAAASAQLLAGLPPRVVESHEGTTVSDGWSLAVVLLGLIAFCSFFAEGAAADWSAVFLRDQAAASAAVAAIGFAGFSLGMAGSRLIGNQLTTAFGPVRVVLTSTVIAAAGLAFALLFPIPVIGVVGFALLGAGLGPVVPTVVSAAAGAGLGALENVVSRVFTIGYFGGVSGPAIIGLIAGQVGLRAALVVPLCLVIYIATVSARLSPAAGGDHPH